MYIDYETMDEDEIRTAKIEDLESRLGRKVDPTKERIYEVEDCDGFHLETENTVYSYFENAVNDPDSDYTENDYVAWLTDCENAQSITPFH